MTEGATGTLKAKIPEWWESEEGHLFLRHVNLQVKDDATVCLRCYKQFEDCYEGQPCESKKDGRWTDIGIEAILTSLKEGDDREIVKIPADAAEIIEQLREAAAKRDARLKAKIDERIKDCQEEPHRVQRKRTKGWKMPENTIYVGRPSDWGNPFKVERRVDGKWVVRYGGQTLMRPEYDDKRSAVKDALKAFRHHIQIIPSFYENLYILKGKNLACWCPIGQPCHADILLELANQ